jgi:hypothetical protein
MRIAALIVYGLICIPGFIIGLPLAMHLLLWPFEDYRWPINLMLFFLDLAIVAAVVARYKKTLMHRRVISRVALLILCIPIVYVIYFTKGEILSSPLFVLPSLAFIWMYIWSEVKPSATAPQLFQKDCCKEA